MRLRQLRVPDQLQSLPLSLGMTLHLQGPTLSVLPDMQSWLPPSMPLEVLVCLEQSLSLNLRIDPQPRELPSLQQLSQPPLLLQPLLKLQPPQRLLVPQLLPRPLLLELLLPPLPRAIPSVPRSQLVLPHHQLAYLLPLWHSIHRCSSFLLQPP